MSRLNLRNKPRISYYELEAPNLDEYVFCSHCGDFVYEYCAIHGPLLVIPDDKPPLISPFPPCVPRAALTIPHVFLHIAPSRIPGAGLGVFTTLTLPNGVRFGPYEGRKTEEISSMYCWQINDYNNKRTYVIDAEDPNQSNWMRYVNCSRHWCEQNLIAYQYKGRLYYRTIKIIPRYTELLVFYGSEFANLLQIDLKNYNAPTSYAQKFGSPFSKHSASKNKKISVVTKCMKKKSSKSTKNSLKSTIEQIKKVPTDVPEMHDKNPPPTAKKNKFNVPNKIQEKSKITNERANNITSNNRLDSKNIYVKSCDVTDQNLNIEVLNKLPNIIYPKDKKDTAEDKTNYEIKNKSEENNNSVQSKHLVQNKFSCDKCNFKTSIEKVFTSHLKAHVAKTKYACTFCDYISKCKSRLSYHIRTHTGEKPFSCNFCSKKFVRKSNLTVHIRTHTGEKPFACNFCNQKFVIKSNLTVHIRTHTGEKPFACNFCNQKFQYKVSLFRHIKTHDS